MYSRPALKTGVPEGQVRAAHVYEEVPDAHPGQLQEHLQLGPHCAGGQGHWAPRWSVQTEKNPPWYTNKRIPSIREDGV